MIMSSKGQLRLISLGAVLWGALVASAPVLAEDSGFLKDYSQLEAQKDPLGQERRVWFSPDFVGAKYQKILLEKVTYYPEPEPSVDVSLGTLNDIRDYSEAGLRKAIASVVPLADAPGPGVARMRVAITAASVDKDLKPYQLLPIGLIVTAVSRATDSSTFDAKLYVESEVTDSVSGEPLARAVRKAEGVEVQSGQELKLDAATPQIDKWLEALREILRQRLGSGS